MDYYSDEEEDYNDYSSNNTFFGSTAAPAESKENDEEQGERLSTAELVNLSTSQLLHPDFVLKQTRGIDVTKNSNKRTNAASAAASVDGSEEKKEEVDDDDETGDTAQLVSTVIRESRVEHITAGLITEKKSEENGSNDAFDSSQARLSRELAALSYSSDSYQNLAHRRAYLVNTLFSAFEQEERQAKASTLKRKRFQLKGIDAVEQTALSSAVHIFLRILQHSTLTNPQLCLDILEDLKQLLNGVSVAAFSPQGNPKNARAVKTFELIQSFLLSICADKHSLELVQQVSASASQADEANSFNGVGGGSVLGLTPNVAAAAATFASQAHNLSPQLRQAIKVKCVEILLHLSVLCSSLSYVSSALKILLFPSTPLTHLDCNGALTKLKSLRRNAAMDQPSTHTLDSRFSVTELSDSSNFTCATDGTYLYIHSSAGLSKIGTGKNATTPGQVYLHIKGYRSYERGSLACIGDKLYFRSATLQNALIIVLSTQYLLEIGSVQLLGNGTYATADLSSIPWFLRKEDKSKDTKKKTTTATVVVDSAAEGAPSAASAMADEKEKEEKKDSAADDASSSTAAAGGDELDMMMKKKQMGAFSSKEEEAKKKQDELEAKAKKEQEEEIKKKQEEEKKELGIADVVKPPSTAPPTGVSASETGDEATGSTGEGGDVPTAPPADGQAAEEDGLIAPAAAASTTSSSSSSSKGKMKATSYFAPLLADDKFLYTVTADKLPNSENLMLSVHAMDTGSTPPLQKAHSVTLKTQKPSSRCVLSFGDAKAKRSKLQGKQPKTTKNKVPDFNNNVNLGCPSHLNTDGGITMATWVKLPPGSWANGNYQALFQHGDQSYRTFLYIYSTSIYAGVTSLTGSGQVNGNVQNIDWGEWNHICVTYDQSRSVWTCYVNGNQIASMNSTTGHVSNSSDWVIGSAPQYPFTGEMCDVVMYKRGITEEQVKKVMNGDIDINDEHLTLWLPLDDGFGLTARDLKFGHKGTLSGATVWNTADRPSKSSTRLETQHSGAYCFHKKSINDAIFWTNGESLAILYPSETAAVAYHTGEGNGVFQSFSLETGMLLEESIHSFAGASMAGCMSPSVDQLYLVQDVKGAASFFRYHSNAPSSLPTWKLSALSTDKTTEADADETLLRTAVPTEKLISKWFDLDADDSKQPTESTESSESGENELKSPKGKKGDSASQDESLSENELKWFCSADAELFAPSRASTSKDSLMPSYGTADIDPSDRVSVNKIIASLLSRLSSESVFAKHPVKVAPPSLQYLLVVDLSPVTFINLLDIIEGLKDEFLYGNSSLSPKERQLRLFTFMTALKLLKINMHHMSVWSVSPIEGGFESEQPKSSSKVETAPSHSPLQRRYLDLLTSLIFTTPRDELSLNAHPHIIELVSDILADGMSIFFPQPLARVRVLSDHLTSLVEGSNPAQQLLTQKYFASQSTSQHVTKLVPCIIRLIAALDSSNNTNGKQQQMATLLDRLVDVVVNDVKRVLHDKLQAKVSGSSSLSGVLSLTPDSAKDTKSNSTSNMTSLLDFLSRAHICLLGRCSSSPLSLKVLIAHSIYIMEQWTSLLSTCVAHLSNESSLSDISFFSDVLRSSVGNMLLPLLSGLFRAPLELQSSTNILPVVFRLLSVLDKFSSYLPEVIAQEHSGSSGQSQRVVIARSTTIESPHPARSGVSQKVLSMPGVTSMTLHFDPKSFSNTNDGSSIQLFKGPGSTNPIDNGTLTTMPEHPIQIQGDRVVIVSNSGYNPNWGWKITAKALVEEETIDIPWALDLCKCVAVFTAKCVGLLLKGEAPDDVEKNFSKWLENELLSHGAEYDAVVEENELKAVSWLSAAKLVEEGEDSDALPSSGPPSFLPRQRSYMGESLPELARSVGQKMLKQNIRQPPFPVRAEVVPLVDEAVFALFAVLIKHNQLTQECKDYLASTDEKKKPSAALVRVWKAPAKLRQWLLQKYQTKRGETNEKEWEEKKMDAGKIYKDMTNDVMKRCDFLLSVLPVVPKELEGGSLSLRLGRTRSQQKRAEESKDGASEHEKKAPAVEMTDSEKLAQATMQAWQATRDTVSLRHAVPGSEERVNLLLKLIFQFLSEPIDLDKLTVALSARRRRARLRSQGFRLLREMIERVKLSSVKRELVAAIVPSLSWTQKEANAGVAADLMLRLQPCGEKLSQELRDSFKSLYTALINILQQPEKSGSQLLQTALHAFSLRYSEEDFSICLGLGIFPVLNHLLLSDIKQLKGASSSATVEEVKEREEKVSEDSVKKDDGALTYQTSAFALLDLLTNVLSKQERDKSGASGYSASEEEQKEPVYEILLSQLEKISSSLLEERHKNAHEEGFIPSLPLHNNVIATLKESQASAETAAIARKVEAVRSFGLTSTIANMNENNAAQSQLSKEDLFSDSYSIRVLNLVDHIAHLPAGSQKVRSKRGLTSLVTVLKFGTPRMKLVALRALRKILVHQEAFIQLDQCVQEQGKGEEEEKSSTSSSEPGVVTARFFLRQLGQVLSAPAYASLALNDPDLTALQHASPEHAATLANVRSILRSLGLYHNFSSEGVLTWSESVDLLRYLIKENESFRKVISPMINESLLSLPSVLKQLQTYTQRKERYEAALQESACATNKALWSQLYPVLGSLAVYGGYIPALSVGVRVKSLSGDALGTVVSRNFTKREVTLVRDGESDVQNVDESDVIVIGTSPFDLSSFSLVDTKTVLQLLSQVIQQVHPSENGSQAASALALPAEGAPALIRAKSSLKPADKNSNGKHVETQMARVTHHLIEAFAVRAFHTLLNHPSVISTFLADPVLSKDCFQSLMATARQLSPYVDPPRIPTGALEDKSAQLHVETFRRARQPADLVISLHAQQARVRFANAGLTHAFEAEFTRLGSHVDIDKTIRSSLSYIKLDEEPLPQACVTSSGVGKIVVLDTYGNLFERLSKVAKLGAKGVILVLHGSSVKAEGLNEEEEEEEEKSSSAGDAIAQAQDNVMGFAMAAAATPAGGFGMAPARGGFGGGRGGFGGRAAAASGRGALPETAAKSKPEKTKKKNAEEEKQLDPLVKTLPIVAVSAETGNSLRMALGVKEEDHPEAVNRRLLSAQIVAKGHSAEHAIRALEKNDMDVEASLKWLADNEEWLSQSNDDLQVEAQVSSSVHSSTSEQIVNKIQAAFNQFSTAYNNSISSGISTAPHPLAILTDTFNGNELSSSPSFGIVAEYVRVQQTIVIHYARRALINLFVQLPSSIPLSLSPFASADVLKFTLRLLLGMETHPASALKPLDIVNKNMSGFKSYLLSSLKSRHASSSDEDAFISQTMLSEIIDLLSATTTQSLAIETESANGKVKTHVANINRNSSLNAPREEVSMPDFSGMRLSFQLDEVSSRNSYQAEINIFDAKESSRLISKAMVTRNDTGDEVVVNGNTFFYTISSPHWYQGAPPMHVVITCKDIPAADTQGKESKLLKGDLSQALDLIDLVMTARKPIPVRVLSLLLACIPYMEHEENANQACRTAIKLFNHSSLLEANSDLNEPSIEKEVAVAPAVKAPSATTAASSAAAPSPAARGAFGTAAPAPAPATRAAFAASTALGPAARVDFGDASAPLVGGGGSFGSFGSFGTAVAQSLPPTAAPTAAPAAASPATAPAPIAATQTLDWSSLPALPECVSSILPDTPRSRFLFYKIKTFLDYIEQSHGLLRTDLLIQWNRGNMPSSSLQVLLELVLAGKKFIDGKDGIHMDDGASAASAGIVAVDNDVSEAKESKKNDDDSDSDDSDSDDDVVGVGGGGFGGGFGGNYSGGGSLFGGSSFNYPAPVVSGTEKKKKKKSGKSSKSGKKARNIAPSEYEVSQYRSYRDGDNTVRLIDIFQRRLNPDLSVASQQSTQREIFIGDVGVRGGKWYYEVRVNQVSDYLAVGWTTRSFRFINNYVNLGQDATGASWACILPRLQYYHRAQDHFPTPIDGASSGKQQTTNMGANGVLGVSLDLENGEIIYYVNGKPTGIAFSGVTANETLYPAIVIGRNCKAKVNFGAEMWSKPPQVKTGNRVNNAQHLTSDGIPFCPLVHPLLSNSSWLSRYRYSSAVTSLIYARKPLPELVLKAALEKEVSLQPTNLRFEIVKHDDPVENSSADNVLVDEEKFWSCSKAKNLHVCLTPSHSATTGTDPDVLFTEVIIRSYRGHRGIQGMIFITNKEPELEMFAHTDNWTEAQYQRFVENKKNSRQSIRAHEPVGYFTSASCLARVKFDTPKKGRYITIKISSTSQFKSFLLDRIQVSSILGSHPLGSLIGTPLLEGRTKEMKDELLKEALTMDSTWTKQMDEQVVALVTGVSSKMGLSSPSSLDAVMVNLGDEEKMKFKLIADVPIAQIRARFAIFKYLNQLVTPLLHYVDIKAYEQEPSTATKAKNGVETETEAVDITQRFDDKSLSYIVTSLKHLYWMSTKKSVFDALMAAGAQASATSAGFGFGSSSSSRPRVNINRLKAAKAKEVKGKDPDGLKSVFGQLWSQLKGTQNVANYSKLRGKKNEQMFSVTFLGEGSIDVGGPYRDLLSQICSELMSDSIPLFIPAPNRKNDVGLNREKFVINPSATSSVHMQMFEFVGALIGMALRTQLPLNLDLSGLIWKRLLGHTIDIADLEGVDKLCVQAMNELSKLTQDKWEYMVEETWKTQLSNGKEFELKEGGLDTPVAFADRDEYIRLSIQARLTESEAQIRALRKGLHQVVPAHLLSLFNWHDLELMSCGSPDIDLELLRKHTLYRNLSASSNLVKWLWKALESFNSEERQAFLRFVWGRSRLPISDSDWNMEFTIIALKADGDTLPISHTCFFSLDLPAYTSYEQLRSKVLYAIFNSQAIDIDFNPNQANNLQAWADVD